MTSACSIAKEPDHILSPSPTLQTLDNLQIATSENIQRMKRQDDDLKYMVDHIFLPPKLPQEYDSETHRKDGVLLDFVAKTSKQFTDILALSPGDESVVAHDVRRVWYVIHKMLKTMGGFYVDGGIIREKLQMALEQMDDLDVLPVLVEAQNAGVIFRKISSSTFSFEAFEVSLPAEDVIGARGKITMRFPTNPALPFAVNAGVLATLANVLAYLSVNHMAESMPFSKKGGEKHFEPRNTASPCFITEALAGVIRAIPPREPVAIKDGEVHKRIDDQVLWKSALKPWRRSSMWLFIRVAMQTTHKQWGTTTGYGYKAFQAFLMASILKEVARNDPERFTCDLLSTMNVKLVKRLCKMSDIIEDPRFTALQTAVNVVSSVSKTLEDRWTKVRELHESIVQWSPAVPNRLHFEYPLAFSFPHSRSFLLEIIKRHDAKDTSDHYFDLNALEASLVRSLPLQTLMSSVHLPTISTVIDGSGIETSLRDVETWVEVHLRSWEKSPVRDEKDCLPLSSLIDDYRKHASDFYRDNPELLSLMHLCIMELWVALDRICVKWCPLFRCFSPEIAENFADPLVVPYFREMKRLDRVQSYLGSRHRTALQHGSHPIFQGVNDPGSFHNEYFTLPMASPLVDLETQIHADAVRRKAAKISELQKLNEHYESLMEQSQSQVCVNNVGVMNRGTWTLEHRDYRCPKCKLRTMAANLKIIPLEDPLPEDILIARPIIFELRCPFPFAIWRDSTMKIILSILGVEVETTPNPDLYPLMEYAPLREYFQESYPGFRISFASSRKSLERSHYGRRQSIPAIESQTLFQHKGAFNFYDTTFDGWIKISRSNGNLRSACAFQLDGLYMSLQPFTNDTRHAPNSVIATVSKAPVGMSPAEYTTFGLLRAGNRIQWRNIMRAIRSQNLSFSEPAVLLLILQSIWQTGPVGDVKEAEAVYREAHVDLEDEEFGKEVAKELLLNVKALGSNWKESNFLAILVILSLRLRSFTPHSSVQGLAQRILREVRDVAMQWITTLLDSPLPRSRKELQDHKPQALANVAVVLRASFNVDDDNTEVFLSNRDVAVYIYTAVLISAVHTRSFPTGIRLLAYRNERIALRIEHHLKAACAGDPSILEQVVELAWPEYSDTRRRWAALPTCSNYWWSPTESTSSQTLHMNIVDGTLLIDGKASDQLPSEYGNHPTFITLFDDYVFRAVRPSPIPGMEYKGSYGAHEVHFGKVGERLTIVRREGTDFQEYIPIESLEKDLPTAFSTRHCFWYSKDKHVIEIRRLSQAWIKDDEQHWTIFLEGYATKLEGKVGKNTASGTQNLVDPNSTLHRKLADTLTPLEPDQRGFFITVLDGKTSAISVHLPRHNLNFSLQENQLECLSLPGYVVDTSLAGIGSLFGLNSVLNLRHSKCPKANRKIIVPKGTVVLGPGLYGTAAVSINIGDSRGYFVYDVDTLIGRLTGTRTMESDLYLAKLHAFTASSLPDPLTRRTGTEEALDRLSNASLLSFHTISKESRSYLDDICILTPVRSFYPTHLEVMETVVWHKYLPISAQHPAFRSRVEEILSSWRAMAIFLRTGDLTEPELDQLLKSPDSPPGLEHLTLRATERDWKNVRSPVVTNPALNLPYIARGSLARTISRNSEETVFRAANLILDPAINSPPCKTLREIVLQWKMIEGSKTWGWDSIKDWLDVPIASPLGDKWCTFFELCRAVQEPTFEIAVTLAFQSFRGVPLELIATLGAVMKHPQFSSPEFQCPLFPLLNLGDGYIFRRETILQFISMHEQSFEESDESNLPKSYLESEVDYVKRVGRIYQSTLEKEREELIRELSDNWPALHHQRLRVGLRLLKPAAPTIEDTVRPLLASWARNKEFHTHIQVVQAGLNSISSPVSRTYMGYAPQYSPLKTRSPSFRRVSLEKLMAERSPRLVHIVKMDPLHLPSNSVYEIEEVENMYRLLQRLESSTGNELQRGYLNSLRVSMTAYKSQLLSTSNDSLGNFNEELFESFRVIALQHIQVYLKQARHYLRATSPAARLMHVAGLWPEVTTHALLQCLSLDGRRSLCSSWLPLLIAHAVSIHDAQRIARMLHLARTGMHSLLEREARYTRVWNPQDHPDWLLVEVEANFSVRAAQAAIAEEMLNPDGNQNTVMQLNMGEGKSSVIVPIVAASASARRNIARVVVLGSQLKQQFQILRRTITGLCNRRIVYLPFNRKISLRTADVARFSEFLRRGTENGAVWICEPEHLLSLKLLGLDRAIALGSRDIIDLHSWLHEHSKDILDESDEILHARQQVVYTVGPQRPLDAAPARWEVVQKVLGLLADYLMNGDASQDKSSFLIEAPLTKAAFPIVRVQSDAASHRLKQFIRKSFDQSDWSIPPYMNASAVEFITSSKPPDSLTNTVRTYCSGEDRRVMETILILRALIGCEILIHSLKERRYRVQYGLDLQRSRLAIPFRAKDSPSPRSEFGHPDVTIVLTCLSYYYEGLDDEMLTHALQSLLASEAPDLTYADWLKPVWAELSPSLQTIRGIDLQDHELLRVQIFPLLRHNKAAIDFYLNAFVFPSHAMEFPFKMSTSGWDIAVTKPIPTTGFSGTNDGTLLLPVTITQTGRDTQLHTNAKVLSYILKKENSKVVSFANFLCSACILEQIHQLSTQPTVILDVGAQILDLSNIEFAKKWLAMYRDHQAIKAVVFFDELNNLLVLTFDGATQFFLDSPYSNQLDQCLVYLDEAHTRGTDLRLPDGKQAVVTLGPKLNKDKLVQGCMRMRKLGHGHTLVFMASEEVINLIRSAGGPATGEVTTEDVIVWSIKETWGQLQADLPAWVLQGHSFVQRKAAWLDLSNGSLPSVKDMSNRFHEIEAQTLENLYGGEPTEKAHWIWKHHSVNSDDETARKIVERCRDFDSFAVSNAGIHEEMEIELMHEKEVEREVQRPPDAEAASHILHPDVKRFVKRGEFALLHSGKGFRTAAAAFAGTSLKVPAEFNIVFPNIMVTEDFWRTIQLPGGLAAGSMDSFMRCVEWVVTVPVKATLCMVLFSPYEVNQLLPTFRTSTQVKLHLFAPRSSLSASSLEDLTFLTLPSNSSRSPLPRPLGMQLNFFSGSLYFQDYRTYLDVCQTLRLHFQPLPAHLAKPNVINANFFVLDPDARRDPELGMTGLGFEMNSLPFFQNMIRMRRFGRGFGPSHMGKILHGARLREEDFVGDARTSAEKEEDVQMSEE